MLHEAEYGEHEQRLEPKESVALQMWREESLEREKGRVYLAHSFNGPDPQY